jgi:ketosteroid isomerase-like protein
MRLDRIVPAFLALGLVLPPAALAAALVQVQHGAPDADVATLVAAELAFCRQAAATSIRDAFFENMAANSILFRPEPVNGKDFYGGRPPNPGPVLTWAPSYAELAGSGDLGWDIGPWEYRSAKDKPVEAWGEFASVWQRQTDGKWKVLFDEGHSCAKPPRDSLAWARLTSRTKDGEMVSLTEFEGAHRRLLAADSAYSKSLLADGVGKALSLYADEDVRVLREDRPMLKGAEAAGKVLEHEWDGGADAWQTQAGAMSKGTDLAVTYGMVTVPAQKKDAATRRKIFRVWRRAPDGGWKLALDVTNGIPAPPPAPKTKKS